jgi:GT2 family glycosyltransferase
MEIVALLATHNRRDTTLDSLASFFGQDVAPEAKLSAVVADAQSSDGTAEAVRDGFRDVRVVSASEDSFWAAAMAQAEAEARTTHPDFLLWLNDDVILEPDAIPTLLATGEAAGGPAYVVVGAVEDPVTGEITYSGLERSSWHPLRMSMVRPTGRAVPVETFNGNVVLVSIAASERIGGIDGSFGHAAADNDFGLRAAKLGVPRLLAPRAVGTCAREAAPEAWADASLTFSERWRALTGDKGHPPRSRARYLRRHAGPAWPIFWLSPYVRALPTLLRRRNPT